MPPASLQQGPRSLREAAAVLLLATVRWCLSKGTAYAHTRSTLALSFEVKVRSISRRTVRDQSLPESTGILPTAPTSGASGPASRPTKPSTLHCRARRRPRRFAGRRRNPPRTACDSRHRHAHRDGRDLQEKALLPHQSLPESNGTLPTAPTSGASGLASDESLLRGSGIWRNGDVSDEACRRARHGLHDSERHGGDAQQHPLRALGCHCRESRREQC